MRRWNRGGFLLLPLPAVPTMGGTSAAQTSMAIVTVRPQPTSRTYGPSPPRLSVAPAVSVGGERAGPFKVTEPFGQVREWREDHSRLPGFWHSLCHQHSVPHWLGVSAACLSRLQNSPKQNRASWGELRRPLVLRVGHEELRMEAPPDSGCLSCATVIASLRVQLLWTGRGKSAGARERPLQLSSHVPPLQEPGVTGASPRTTVIYFSDQPSESHCSMDGPLQ